jgi:hypothetical protein
VPWDRHMKLRTCPVKQSRVASSLVVNIESGPLERCDNLPRLEDGQLRRHEGSTES